MNAQDWKLLISAYVDGEVSREEADQAEKLLFERPECRAYFNELKKISSSLQTIPDEKLSSDAELNVLSTIKKERVMKTTYWKQYAGAAAMLLVVVLTFQNYVKHGIQGRLKSATDDIGSQYSSADATYYRKKDRIELAQAVRTGAAAPSYEPYYTKSEPATPSPARALLGTKMSVQNGFKGTQEGMEAYAEAGYKSKGYNRIQRNDVDRYAPSIQYVVNVPVNTEEYKRIEENRFFDAADDPLSTLSADVDTASYSIVRRDLLQRQMPDADAVRIEEMINYFDYDYPQPWFGQPFSITTDLATCPWAPGHQLMRVGLKGKVPSSASLPPSNLVFLIDVSGSMADADKLPLLKAGFKMMVDQLRPEDHVSIVVYASTAGQVLSPTSGADKDRIIRAIDRLNANGSTAGGEGIRLAYQVAGDSFISRGNNRVILATDGDFNVGTSSVPELERMIEAKRGEGIFLTVLGFGRGNLKDNIMQALADKGNGNYAYIDSFQEAHKVLVKELGSTLFTIAKDVKIQVEFNPAAVKAYRLIGYEKRLLNKQDFNNDRKDAGEIGAGHTVTALYEIVPQGAFSEPNVDPLKYRVREMPSFVGRVTNEVATVKLRYKEPQGDTSKLMTKTVKRGDFARDIKGDFAWASAVAEFGMLLRGSGDRGYASYDHVLSAARNNIGKDPNGLRAEFIDLVETARSIDPQPQHYPVEGEGGYDHVRPDQYKGQIEFK
jgi:Ca-activated chloride channel family protein